MAERAPDGGADGVGEDPVGVAGDLQRPPAGAVAVECLLGRGDQADVAGFGATCCLLDNFAQRRVGAPVLCRRCYPWHGSILDEGIDADLNQAKGARWRLRAVRRPRRLNRLSQKCLNLRGDDQVA